MAQFYAGPGGFACSGHDRRTRRWQAAQVTVCLLLTTAQSSGSFLKVFDVRPPWWYERQARYRRELEPLNQVADQMNAEQADALRDQADL
jgi:hypothetical protein